MSRYPFMEFVNEFMAGMEGVYSPSTVPGLMRRYKRISRELIDLKESGKISSTSPRKLTADDIKVFLVMRRSKDLSRSEIRRDISALSNICIFCENNCVKQCLLKYPKLKPSSRSDPRLTTFTAQEYARIVSCYNDCERDYRHVRAYAMVFIAMYCGTRTKELRYLNAEDLDLEEDLITINHPKGEDSYGVARVVPVPPALVSLLKEYMELREQFMDDHDLYSRALFPSSETDGYLTDKSIRAIKTLVEEETGLRFDFRKCRRSFGQNYIDMDLELQSVSVLMGHTTTKTTERFYGRRRNDRAIENARKVWRDANMQRIDFRNSIAGYEGIVPKAGFEPANSYENRS